MCVLLCAEFGGRFFEMDGGIFFLYQTPTFWLAMEPGILSMRGACHFVTSQEFPTGK